MPKTRLLFLTVTALILFAMIPFVSAQPRTVISESTDITIIDAYYGDLDGDACEDDIKILLEFRFPNDDPVRVDLNIWIELPSGLTYNVRISVYRAPAQSILNIDCIDMATESGWYTVTMLASVMGTGNGKYYITDQLIFDPPTGAGPGLPDVKAYF
ncbi:MAG: conserved exported protein of unknown function [Candidatus Thorarchaeota archaeon]|nr:MAG: conserved exported protein of unknown function [Candidatus Thorarchaeota archaeon]